MIAHASISENRNTGWDGKAKAGDQTGREVYTRSKNHTNLNCNNEVENDSQDERSN